MILTEISSSTESCPIIIVRWTTLVIPSKIGSGLSVSLNSD